MANNTLIRYSGVVAPGRVGCRRLAHVRGALAMGLVVLMTGQAEATSIEPAGTGELMGAHDDQIAIDAALGARSKGLGNTDSRILPAGQSASGTPA